MLMDIFSLISHNNVMIMKELKQIYLIQMESLSINKLMIENKDNHEKVSKSYCTSTKNETTKNDETKNKTKNIDKTRY